MLQVTESSVRYAAETKLLELAYEISGTRKPMLDKVQQGTNIFLWLQALDYGEFLTKEQKDQIVLCLIELANIYDFPIAPELNNQETPVVIGGSNTIINNYTYNTGTYFINTDVDTGTETVDSFSLSDARGAMWVYNVRSGSNQRTGIVTAGWLADGSSITVYEDATSDIGTTTDVVLDVDLSAGSIRLRATAASNNWVVEGIRILITA